MLCLQTLYRVDFSPSYLELINILNSWNLKVEWELEKASENLAHHSVDECPTCIKHKVIPE